MSHFIRVIKDQLHSECQKWDFRNRMILNQLLEWMTRLNNHNALSNCLQGIHQSLSMQSLNLKVDS